MADLADDCVFHFGGDGPNSGDHKGREAIAAALIKNFELTAGAWAFARSAMVAVAVVVAASVRKVRRFIGHGRYQRAGWTVVAICALCAARGGHPPRHEEGCRAPRARDAS